MPDSLQTLAEHIPDCMVADQHRLRQQWQTMSKQKPVDQKKLSSLSQQIEKSLALTEKRKSNLPDITYDDTLPVSEQRLTVREAIEQNQVVIVAGETGSGKTTQIPKICLELGRGISGMIGHTQPRRIAARTVASRIAEELKSDIGQHVGYKIRFKDHTRPESYIKLMTDGILLSETHSDRFLNQYDTIIIDEAHERSLNIDFLLGYLKQLLSKRPDLKLIITSATIDPERFSKHFYDAPIIEVSGRTYPVELRYRPLAGDSDDDKKDITQGILDAVDELGRDGPGDVLVFLSGEREIRETAEALRKHHPPQTEILPLYSRLSAAEQNRIFQSHQGRRVVLATNVAETSLTVPGIRYVIDPGMARISRYSYRSKVQRLPIEKISQASANQRKGRCGRVSAGICIRLYDEDDFNKRPEFTEPEIQRTNLASVILQMQALKLGDIEHFPFVDPPDSRFIKDGIRLLEEIQAIENDQINKQGRQLSRFPVDPRLARMLIAAVDYHSLKEILIIVSALSIQDPRERPHDKRQSADEAHTRFTDERSDFLSLVNLWDFYQEQRHHLSQNKLRKLCKTNFLSYVRMEEWRDIHSQLHSICTELKLKENSIEAEYANIHQALLTGLLSNIGCKYENNEFLGARNSKLVVFPGSGQHKKPPKWIMAATLLETARLYAHTVARIEPEWVEQQASHLLKHSYTEPHWQKRSATVAAKQKSTLYGLVIIPEKKVNYGPIDPALSREVFIREALVQQQYLTRAEYYVHNSKLIEEIEELENKSRRQDILIDEQTLFDFYNERIPQGIYSGKHFETWRKQAETENPKLLFLTKDYLMRHGAEHVTEEQFPKQISIDGTVIHLEYHFEPGHPQDGVTAVIPLTILNRLSDKGFDWLVPGLLTEKVIHLIKSLPKPIRRNFVPVPDYAKACIDNMQAQQGSLVKALTLQLKRMVGIDIPDDAWQLDNLPDHLLMNFRVVDHKKQVAQGRDLSLLQQQLQNKASQQFEKLTDWEIEQKDLTSWSFGDIPESVESHRHGILIQGYPALVDKLDSVAIQVFDNPHDAGLEMHYGMRRLFMLQLNQQLKYLTKNLPGINTICLHYAPIGKCEDIKQDIINAVFDQTFLSDGQYITSEQEFTRRVNEGQDNLVSTANKICKLVEETLQTFHHIRKRLKARNPSAWLQASNDITHQLDELIYPGFISETPLEWLAQYPRYMKAIEKRLDKLQHAADKDSRLMQDLSPLWQHYLDYIENEGDYTTEIEEYRWLIEELRVSLFAQELKTVRPVSVKRVNKLWQEITNN